MGGEEAVQQGGVSHGGGGMGDVFDMFMGGGGRQRQQRKRTKDQAYELQVTLEEIFAGKTKKLSIERYKICKICKGMGGEGAATCTQCKGKGMVTRIVQLGPGMITQTTNHCDMCSGEGTIIPEGKKCKSCKTQKIVKEKDVIEINLDKGVPNNKKQTFPGMSDEYPDHEAGDVIITVKEKEHKMFKRKQADIALTLKITLQESLVGFEKEFLHLDGQKHIVRSPPGMITKPESVKTVLYMGLPLHNNPAVQGNLFIHFEIDFPKELNTEQQKMVMELLSAQKPKAISNTYAPENSHECINFEKAHVNENKKDRKEAYDDDDEEGGQGGRQQVRCENQ